MQKQNWVDNLFRLINLPSNFLTFSTDALKIAKFLKYGFFRSQYYRINLVLQIQALAVSKFILQNISNFLKKQ
jgi:hypothetical protein